MCFQGFHQSIAFHGKPKPLRMVSQEKSSQLPGFMMVPPQPSGQSTLKILLKTELEFVLLCVTSTSITPFTKSALRELKPRIWSKSGLQEATMPLQDELATTILFLRTNFGQLTSQAKHIMPSK